MSLQLLFEILFLVYLLSANVWVLLEFYLALKCFLGSVFASFIFRFFYYLYVFMNLQLLTVILLLFVILLLLLVSVWLL